ncbi:MAG TPA: hypothetical protein VKR06_46670 [Ktedonosporobacter sp.]|nr:hypothetical protein [Ktedonosporobacter sp.]
MGRQSKGFTQKIGQGWNTLFSRKESPNAPTSTQSPNTAAPQPTTQPLGSSNSTDVLGDLFGNGHQPKPGQAGPNATPQLQQVEGGQLNLVNYSPGELLQQVDSTLSRVQFGMSRSRKYMHAVGDIWANVGPWVLLAGTVGEVFAFIWVTTTNNDPKNNPAWWVALSILATVISLEATFMVVSFKSAAVRNDAESRPNGVTDRDKKTLRQYRGFWYVLATFVGIGQVAFLLDAMTQNFTKITGWFILLVTFAILRTVGTLVSDYYTAFQHKETPTTAEQATEELDQRAVMAAKLLEQKGREVTIINEGTLNLQRAHTNAEIEQDTIQTELAMKKMENRNRVETLRKQQEQADKLAKLSTNIMGALFDPDMPDEQRQKVLGGLQALMQVNKQLEQIPDPRQHPSYQIEERESEE